MVTLFNVNNVFLPEHYFQSNKFLHFQNNQSSTKISSNKYTSISIYRPSFLKKKKKNFFLPTQNRPENKKFNYPLQVMNYYSQKDSNFHKGLGFQNQYT